MAKRKFPKKIKEVPVQKPSDAEFAMLSAMADSTRKKVPVKRASKHAVKKMKRVKGAQDVMVPCATVPKKYFKQLQKLREKQDRPLSEMAEEIRRKDRKSRK